MFLRVGIFGWAKRRFKGLGGLLEKCWTALVLALSLRADKVVMHVKETRLTENVATKYDHIRPISCH